LLFFRQQPTISNNLPKPLKLSTSLPSATAKTTATYVNDQFKFQFEYPNDWVVSDLNIKGEKNLHSILQLAPQSYKGKVIPIKLIYVENPNQLSYQGLEKKINPDLNTPILYSNDDAYMLSGKGIAIDFRDFGICDKVKCQIYTFSKESNVYQLISYPDANITSQFDIFNLVMNSFKFADSRVMGASHSANLK
jgi:hypothetical protein